MLGCQAGRCSPPEQQRNHLMNRATLTITAMAAATIALAGCSSSKTSPAAAPAPADHPTAAAPAKAATALTADQAFAAITKTVPSAKLGGEVTAASDPNHLLGRPDEYTSKITFTDSRVSASDAANLPPGDIDLGGSVEVFATAADAQARATYIQAVVKGVPAAAEYDYEHGTILIRVSHYLTPAQAADYQKAAASLG
jgi:hypothetical protein